MLEHLFCGERIRNRVAAIFLDSLQHHFGLLLGQETILMREFGDEEPSNNPEEESDGAFNDLKVRG